MGLLDFFRRARESRPAPSFNQTHEPLSIRESLGWPDPDAFLEGHQNFRAASGKSVRRIPDGERRRVLQMSWEERRQNPIANRIIGVRADFMVGSGITPVSKDEQLAHFLKDFWTDPVNNFPIQLHAIASAFRSDGELLAEPIVNTVTGRTRILWHDVAAIGTVLPHQTFVTWPGRIQMGWNGGGIEAVVVAPGEPEVEWSKIDSKHPGVMFFRANAPIGDLRGLGDLYHSWEYILELDNAAFAMLERFNVAISYIWHVTSKGGMNDAEADHVLSVLRSGKPGDTIYTRPDVTISSLIPAIPAVEFSDMFRTIKNVVLGGAAMPEAWFADGDAANRATVQGQADPTFRAMDRAQAEFLFVLRTVVDFAKARAEERGLIGVEAAQADYELIRDPVNQKDEMRLADVLVKLGTVLDYGTEIAGAMTRKEAALAFRKLAAPLTGIAPELPEELAKIFDRPMRPPQVRPDGQPDEEIEEAAAESFKETFRRYSRPAA